MIATLDTMLVALATEDPIEVSRFSQACAACYPNQDFQIVLEMLCRLAHPLSSPMRSTTEETACVAGRQEVVALLIRHGAAEPVPSILTKQ